MAGPTIFEQPNSPCSRAPANHSNQRSQEQAEDGGEPLIQYSGIYSVNTLSILCYQCNMCNMRPGSNPWQGLSNRQWNMLYAMTNQIITCEPVGVPGPDMGCSFSQHQRFSLASRRIPPPIHAFHRKKMSHFTLIYVSFLNKCYLLLCNLDPLLCFKTNCSFSVCICHFANGSQLLMTTDHYIPLHVDQFRKGLNPAN